MIESTLNRRKFTSQLVGGVTALTMMNIPLFGKGNFINSDDVVWRNVEEFGVEGKGWSNTKRYFDRLPSKAEGMVRQPVWDLSRHSSGMSVRFVTDSPNIQVRYSLLKEGLAMPHMPATGVSGLDLYAQDDQGLDRWVSVVFPKKQIIETTIAKDLKPGSRRYTMYLPLYNGVESLEIGVDKGTYFEGLAPRNEKPILFYGTSIMQGACASRPGLAIPAILGRRLRRPTINLGFSGNGRMEGEVGALLAEQNPCAFAIDCLPNMNSKTVSDRAEPLVRQLRNAQSKTPILLVEDRSFTNTPFFPNRKKHHQMSREALKKTYHNLKKEGIENLFYLDGDHLLGLDGEATTDGSHPNDLGMMRYADAYEPALRAMLGQY